MGEEHLGTPALFTVKALRALFSTTSPCLGRTSTSCTHFVCSGHFVSNIGGYCLSDTILSMLISFDMWNLILSLFVFYIFNAINSYMNGRCFYFFSMSHFIIT